MRKVVGVVGLLLLVGVAAWAIPAAFPCQTVQLQTIRIRVETTGECVIEEAEGDFYPCRCEKCLANETPESGDPAIVKAAALFDLSVPEA